MRYNLKTLEYADCTHIEFFTSPINCTQSQDENKETHVINKIPIIEDLQRDLNKDKNSEKSLNISVNRSKKNLYKIARANNWEWFCTLTFDRKEDNKFNHKVIDSSDYEQVSKTFTKWINSIKRSICPDLKYLAVPEYHKDKKHFHFHLLIANTGDLEFIPSGIKDCTGSEMYNIIGWEYGFSTATKVKDNGRVTNYIGKYITKDLMNKIKYKKRYYASDNVDLPQEKKDYINPDDLYKKYDPETWSFVKTVNGGGYNQVKYIEIPKVKNDVDI